METVGGSSVEHARKERWRDAPQSFQTFFGNNSIVLIPTSSSTLNAYGWIDSGFSPALCTSKCAPARLRRSASAIWLRAAFAVHRKSTAIFLELSVMECLVRKSRQFNRTPNRDRDRMFMPPAPCDFARN